MYFTKSNHVKLRIWIKIFLERFRQVCVLAKLLIRTTKDLPMHEMRWRRNSASPEKQNKDAKCTIGDTR